MTVAVREEVACPLTIRLFGPMDVCLSGGPLPRLRSRKGYWLLALLVLRHGREVDRSWLAGVLWPDSGEAQAAASLRNSLTDLRHALGTEAGRLRSPTVHTLSLDLEGADVDVAAFDAALARGDHASLEEAVERYRGPLLEGCLEEWVFQEQQAREQGYLKTLETLAAQARESGDPVAAERYLRRAVAADPLRETAQRALMEALAAMGQYAAATEAYRELRRLLERDLSTQPSGETIAVFEQIRAEARRSGVQAFRRSGVPGRLAGGGPRAEGERRPVAPATQVPTQRSDPGSAPDATIDPGTPARAARAVPKVALLCARYAQPDEQLLGRLEAQLRARGYPVFVERRRAVGVAWAAEVERQIRGSTTVIALISPAAVHSEMLACELEIARRAGQEQGAPQILPIRIDDTEALPEPLAGLPGLLLHLTWGGPEDDERLVAELIATLERPPEALPTVPKDAWEAAGDWDEPVRGAVPLNSRFWVVRPTEHEFRAALARQDGILLVKGARQMGKTSLLGRGLQQARESGAHGVWTDFQQLNAPYLESAEKLFLALGMTLADQLDLDALPGDVWNSSLTPSMNFTRYVRREVLRKIAAPIVWGLDEADRLVNCEFGSEVFGLLRSWYNQRVTDPTGSWSRLTLAIAYATEAHLIITDVNQSPFNVGTWITLEDFTPEQVADLNRRYGSPLRERGELERFYQLVGGHPHLVRCGLREMATRGVGFAEIQAQADRDEGIFGDHLRRLLVVLAQNAELVEVARGVLQGQPCPTAESFYRLRSAGVLAGESPRDVRLRCHLYAAYLRKQLM